MLIAALAAFAAAATAGIFLAMRHFLRKRLPVWVALMHGLGGAIGFTLVLLTVVREPNFQPARQALYLFIATVALGSVNLVFHIRGKRHRTSLIVMHALTAVSGVGTLIYAIASHGPAEAATPPAETAPPTEPAPPIASATAPPAEATASATAAAADAPADAGAPDTAAKVDTPAKFELPAELRRALQQPVAFATKSSAILPESRGVIRQIATLLNKHPEVSLIEVQGHADERGAESENLELTRGRAAAVVDALVQEGVSRERLSSAGYAARCPATPACRTDVAPASCHEPGSWQRDRRVVFLPLQIGEASFQGEVVCERGADLIPSEHARFHVPGGKRE